ncbi:hypothetical protein LOZ67_004454 [Ophidiomyces ophidiicola]|nr:hypothetical protein LOZ51_000358 [Ophidiomyces ophidiicola]KAI2165235.1 hypothetical protein LOZ26_000865 [Ophidiomyces ophidiicola]KAI2195079.1 hypothetical protein LOZ21_000161 [Ophidiomyces ophidiicola]KAI2398785.1 hypothetical protein LOZ67_004454 [Ophidiomyces ophidiicola]KAI2444467.1 hypothetical protein LOZ30_001787 [Ophidiomyces ophidiicola]
MAIYMYLILLLHKDRIACSSCTNSRFGNISRYTIAPNFHGFTLAQATKAGVIASGFGVAAGIFAVFFFGEVPRVRQDILMNVPVIGGYWERKIAPEDNSQAPSTNIGPYMHATTARSHPPGSNATAALIIGDTPNFYVGPLLVSVPAPNVMGE